MDNYVGALKLRKPIYINGAERKEVRYDFDALTVTDMLDIDKARGAEGRVQPVIPKLEGYTQFMLFCAAAAKVDSAIAPEDLMRMSAHDGMAAQELARDFLLESSEDGEEEISEEL